MRRWAAAVAVLLAVGCSSGGGTDRDAADAGRSPTASPGAVVPTRPSATPTGTPAADWPTYHRTNDRAGFVPGMRAPTRLDAAWAHELDGAVYGQPVVVGGVVYTATEGDTVYAFDLATGRERWRRHLGEPVPRSDLPCGNIDPLGITGTPAYDAATGSLFVVAEVRGPRHDLVALDARSGAVRWRRAVDIAGRDPAAEQQRGALTVAKGRVYAPFGGLYGDCGNYVGYVAAMATDGIGPVLRWAVPTPREGGIWAASGAAVDAAGDLYVAVGNGESTGRYDGSDSVTKLSPTLQRLGFFAPREWADHNAADADLGSMGPILVPPHHTVIAGKSATTFLLDARDLGGIGGEQASVGGCAGFGGAARRERTVFMPCTDGLRRLDVGADGTLRWGWRSDATGSPVVGGDTVWTLDTGAGRLLALDAATGTERASRRVGAVTRFASPTLAGDLVLVGTVRGVIALRAG